MSDLLSRMNERSPGKRNRPDGKLRDRSVAQDWDAIHPESAGANPPASFAQQRLWFLDQWQPGSSAYNMLNVVRIDGPLDIDALQRALTEVVRRHETLRTTFAATQSGPIQVIHPPSPVSAEVIDLSALSQDKIEQAVSDRIQAESVLPFNLEQGPLFRPMLLRLQSDKHVLMLSMHHIISDGWSLGVLQRELSVLYDAFIAGRPSPLADLPIQYADFAVWQRRRLQGEVLEKQVSYWREQLRDVPTLDLPADRPRPPMQRFRGEAVPVHMPKRLLEELKALSRKESATLFMTLLAAFQTLLHRYSGQDDVTVGTPIAGRTSIETEPLIGFFVNMLVLRTDTSGDPPFRELLRRIQQVALSAYEHQETPFERLVEEVHPRRDPSRNPLFQILFALQNMPQNPLSLSGLTVEKIEQARRNIRFDLEVHLSEVQDGLSGRFIYNTALFESDAIERMAEHFRTLLEGAAANPDERLSRLPLLSERETHQLLVAWNQTQTQYPRSACIHELFNAQAEAAPERLAVAFEAERLTYRELNESANRLAHHLRTFGVGPDVLVGVCLERSIHMVIAFLAILKAGGAYVPLDPSYPGERLAFMMKDAKLSVLLTHEKLNPTLPDDHCPVVSLDALHLDHLPSHSPASGATAENLAYVIFTSGSTGQPKGVAVPHRAVIRLVRDANYVQLDASDRIAQTSNASFDVAAVEIWGALLNGGALVGIPQHILLAPKDFAQEIRAQEISIVCIATALFNRIAAETPFAFQKVRYVFVAGEACDPDAVRKVLNAAPPQHLVNAYGPTESTGYATTYRIEAVSGSATTIPIGRPISNTTAYVLDRNLQPVPAGVTGELYIGGDGLAREYLNRPELTADKFIRNPFSNDPSSRLYRTGDFVRYMADGNIDFLGRMDQQVKIRGFRIELEEIEATISQHPGVRISAVAAKAGSDGDKRLIAYVVPESGTEISTEELRRLLRQRLPDYMIPSAIVTLHSLPLTPNGKLDYAALPEPDLSAQERVREFVAPRTSAEKALAEIWKEVLRVGRIGVDDNFFDLGGHSLLAIQLIARIESRFGISVPVATLFESPTIGQLAKLLQVEHSSNGLESLTPIQPTGSKPPFFWILGNSSNTLLPNYLGPDQPLYSLEHQARDGMPAAYTDVQSIASHYIDEIRAVRPHGPYLLGGYSFGALTAFEMAHQLKRGGEEVSLIFMLDPPGRIKHSRERRGLRDVWQRLRCKYYVKTGNPLPASLRAPYVVDVYRRALRSYTAQPYSGRVAVVKTKDVFYEPPLDWRELIRGPLDIAETLGTHTELTIEPCVSQWAPRLKTALEAINGASPRTGD